MVQCDWCDKLFKKQADVVKHNKEYKQVDARADKSSTNTSRCGRRCVKLAKVRKGKGKGKKEETAAAAADAVDTVDAVAEPASSASSLTTSAAVGVEN